MNDRGVAERWPVMLGGAALTRAYVEQDLAGIYAGDVRYARDAFEGLRLMDAFMAVKRGEPGAELPALRTRKVGPSQQRLPRGGRRSPRAATSPSTIPCRRRRSGGRAWSRASGSRTTRPTSTSAPCSSGKWGLKSSRGEGPDYDALVEIEGRPRLRMWLDRVHTEGLLEAAVVYGYFPCWSEGDELVILDPAGLAEAGERPLDNGWQPVERSAALPAPGSRPAPVPCGLLPAPRGGPARADRRRRLPRRDDGHCGLGRGRGALRGQTPTATTSSCTACRSSSPRRWLSTGTPGSVRSWASTPPTPSTGRS